MRPKCSECQHISRTGVFSCKLSQKPTDKERKEGWAMCRISKSCGKEGRFFEKRKRR